MTDQEKLREYITLYEGFPAQEMQDWLKTLRRIASLLDAVPPETLDAIKDGTFVVMPKVPSRELLQKAGCSAGDYHALLAAAPAKPEG